MVETTELRTYPVKRRHVGVTTIPAVISAKKKADTSADIPSGKALPEPVPFVEYKLSRGETEKSTAGCRPSGIKSL